MRRLVVESGVGGGAFGFGVGLLGRVLIQSGPLGGAVRRQARAALVDRAGPCRAGG
ncbi:hypothetical protein ACWENA_01495 [Streptomyces sp. NPDC004779]